MTKMQLPEEPWYICENGVRNHGGFIVFGRQPMRYGGQDERYERELSEIQNSLLITAAAPNLFRELQKVSGALQEVLKTARISEDLVFKFTGEFEHLGSATLGEILDTANAALDKAMGGRS